MGSLQAHSQAAQYRAVCRPPTHRQAHSPDRQIPSGYDFDITKLSVNTLSAGLAGIEVYDLLRDEYDIQTEFGDLGNVLAYVSVGDRPRDAGRTRLSSV